MANEAYPYGVVVVSESSGTTKVSGLYPYISDRPETKWNDLCKALDVATNSPRAWSATYSFNDSTTVGAAGDMRWAVVPHLVKLANVPADVILIEPNMAERAAKYVKQKIDAGEAHRHLHPSSA